MAFREYARYSNPDDVQAYEVAEDGRLLVSVSDMDSLLVSTGAFPVEEMD